MQIYIENEYEGEASFLTREEYTEAAQSVCGEALRSESCPFAAEVNVLLTGDEEIRRMNQEFRGIDQSTDVLSFPLAEYEEPACFDGFEEQEDLFDPDSGNLMLGDIVISVDTCVRQAAEYGHSLLREYAFLLAHSMLHLMGYDHMAEDEAAVMEARQEAILERVGITRDLT